MSKVIKFPRKKKMIITLYTRPGCSLCEKAKSLLEKNGFFYDEYDIDKGTTKQDLLESYPSIKTLPVVFVNDVMIGGYHQLVDVLEKERLEI